MNVWAFSGAVCNWGVHFIIGKLHNKNEWNNNCVQWSASRKVDIVWLIEVQYAIKRDAPVHWIIGKFYAKKPGQYSKDEKFVRLQRLIEVLYAIKRDLLGFILSQEDYMQNKIKDLNHEIRKSLSGHRRTRSRDPTCERESTVHNQNKNNSRETDWHCSI